MDVPARRNSTTDDAPEYEVELEESDSIVTSHETSPGNVVFTERHNTDGWIASDLAVELER